MTNNINGIDVATNNNIYYSQKAVDELLNDIKRLQEENEGLKSLNDFNVQKIEVLQEENEKLYKALEEIRKEANRLLYEENPIYGYNNSNYFEILAKYVLAKTKEALNDRDWNRRDIEWMIDLSSMQ